MKNMKGLIEINDIRLYACHGCLEEETTIGGNYVVNIKIHADYLEAALSDDLSKTIDYCTVFEIAKREMLIPSKLIEHAAYRIALALKKEISGIDSVHVLLTKISPPVNGDLGSVTVSASL